jgi:hypothetical protein
MIGKGFTDLMINKNIGKLEKSINMIIKLD